MKWPSLHWRTAKQSSPSHASLWRTIEGKVYLGPVVSASEWGTILQTVADELEKHVVRNAGPPVGLYFEESPVKWLRDEAMKARQRI